MVAPATSSGSTRRRATSAGVVLAAVLAVAALPAPAAMYKWTDANGRVVYSDQPPPANVNSETVAPPPPPANPNAAKELANKQAELLQKKQARAEEETKAAKARADADKKRELCDRQRSQIALLQSQNLIYRANAKGEQVLMDDAARAKERDQISASIRENCGR